jgi:hypothetical protein
MLPKDASNALEELGLIFSLTALESKKLSWTGAEL